MAEWFVSMFSPTYGATIVYMLQSTEYQPLAYLQWFWRVKNFHSVAYRRSLDKTKAARLLLAVMMVGMVVQIVAGIVCIVRGQVNRDLLLSWFGIWLVFSYPIIWAHLVVVPLVLGRLFVIGPRERRQIKASRTIFAKHPGVTIAVAGSYGKTSMKELLLTVLSEGKVVAATPANKNVASSHAIFAARLTGKEDVLIIEYGEGKPGDVDRFASTTAPDIGIITGLAPAHLDHYPNLQAAGKDIFSLADYLHGKDVYVNAESEAAKEFLQPSYVPYSESVVADWKIRNIKVDYDGTTFELHKGKRVIRLKSGLLGRHQVGPLALAAVLAMKLGLSDKQVTSGIAKTQPYEHRMQPRNVHGAWIIDDTYNGNIDGIRAGLQLLQDLPAQRKTYVTPGLVDQGVETEAVHIKMGELITRAHPDTVVLMQNSVTSYIRQGLEAGGFGGVVRIEEHPLEFYTNLEHFLARGDLVVMQNDWTDNYA